MTTALMQTGHINSYRAAADTVLGDAMDFR